ncbi:MAG: VaFE repeat-containing surface-anchored protein, partial [Clostridium sp.]
QPDDSKGALYYDTYHIKEQRCSSNEGMNLLEFEVTVYKNAVTIDLGTLTDDRIEITTSAKDDKTGGHMSKPEEKVTLIDTVEYEGLKKGQEYRLVGTLMNQETGKPLTIAGKKVTSETTFKAKKSSGTVEVNFEFNGSDLGGKTVVVFEELYHDKVKLAAHADITDKDQTIYFPKIKTTAKDSETNTKISNPDSKVILLDMVSYENLIPGKEYKVSGTLMDKESKKPLEVDGKPVTSEAIFTPKESKGSIEIVFEFDGSELAGKTTVVFESLTYKEKEIAVHADIEDEAQTIMFPKLKTTAKDGADGDQEVIESSNATIVDTVSYENLISGETYRVIGILMDKTTGAELMVNGAAV